MSDPVGTLWEQSSSSTLEQQIRWLLAVSDFKCVFNTQLSQRARPRLIAYQPLTLLPRSQCRQRCGRSQWSRSPCR